MQHYGEFHCPWVADWLPKQQQPAAIIDQHRSPDSWVSPAKPCPSCLPLMLCAASSWASPQRCWTRLSRRTQGSTTICPLRGRSATCEQGWGEDVLLPRRHAADLGIAVPASAPLWLYGDDGDAVLHVLCCCLAAAALGEWRHAASPSPSPMRSCGGGPPALPQVGFGQVGAEAHC